MPPLMSAALQGFSLGASLIVAIGAQNAFVLRQGLLRQYVGAIVLVCAAADALLIAAGVAGFGTLVAAHPSLLQSVRLAGAGFLFWYGVNAFRRAVRRSTLAPTPSGVPGLARTLATCCALTFLNPHVYLDTVILLGGIAGGFAGSARAAFALGAMTASLAWFSALGFGARLLQPVFAKALAWRVLDSLIGATMCLLAVALLRSASG